MPFYGIKQPEFVYIDENIRLRAYDGNYLLALPWYQDRVVYYNSEGIVDEARIPDKDYVKSMFDYFEKNGKSEMYFIEIKQDGVFLPIGDAAVQQENPPIVIGVAEYRGIGIGKKVLNALIERAKAIGIKGFYNTVIFDYNMASRKLYESAGFICIQIKDNQRIYELIFQ